MSVSAHDVAEELRRRQPELGATKLHKLLYYAQGWHLASEGEPMFEERIEARLNGPVVSSLGTDETHGRERPEPIRLSSAHLATIEYILSRYGHESESQLVRRTHQESPWLDVSERYDSLDVGNPEITHEALRRYFSQDDEFVAHRAEVERLRKRRDVYGFEGPAVTPSIRAMGFRVLGHDAG
jgi:uncharacterized phage-associated protein